VCGCVWVGGWVCGWVGGWVALGALGRSAGDTGAYGALAAAVFKALE